MPDLQRRLSELAAWSMGWVWPDRSADVEAAAFAQKAFDAVDLLFPETEGGRWHLKFLGIHPAWQRRGVGRLLCERGMEEARKEKLPAMLEASPVGEGLYASLGFRVIGELVVKELGVRGPVMRWDPPV